MVRDTQVLPQDQTGSGSSWVERAFALLALRILEAVTRLSIWVKRAYDYSWVGRTLSAVYHHCVNLVSHSVSGKILGFLFKVGFLPALEDSDDSLTAHSMLKPEIFLGVSLGLAAIFPIELVFIALILCIVYAFLDRVQGVDTFQYKAGILDIPEPGILVLAAVFFLILVGATVSSVVPQASLYNLVLWGIYLLVFFLCYDVGFKKKEEYVILPFLAFAALSSMVGIYQQVSGWQPPRSWLDARFEDEIVRIVGTFSNPTFFAEMLGLALPVTIALFLKKRAFLQRLLLLAYCGLEAAALLFTYSRGAWLGFIASFCILAVLYERKLLIVGLVLGIILLMLLPHVILERLLSSFTLNDSSNSYRLFIWRGSLAMLKDTLFRGVGLGAESFVQVYPEYMIIQTPAPHAHSTYLEMLIELGLLGFLVLAAFLLFWAYIVFKSIISEKVGRGGTIMSGLNERWKQIGVMAGLFSAIGGHMVQALVEYTWYSSRITVIYWAFAGLSLGIACRRKAQRGETLEPNADTSRYH